MQASLIGFLFWSEIHLVFWEEWVSILLILIYLMLKSWLINVVCLLKAYMWVFEISKFKEEGFNEWFIEENVDGDENLFDNWF